MVGACHAGGTDHLYGRCGVPAAHVAVLLGHARVLLAYGVLLGHPRHSRRRILYAGAFIPSAGGIRRSPLHFYRIASVIGQGGLVMLAGHLEKSMQDIPAAWSTVFMALSAFFLAVTLYHLRFLPKPAPDKPRNDISASGILSDFGPHFRNVLPKAAHSFGPLLHALLYRLPEAMCIELVQPFLVAPRDTGGLGLTTAEVGFVQRNRGRHCAFGRRHTWRTRL